MSVAEAAQFEVRPVKSGLHACTKPRPGFAVLNCGQAAQSAAKTKPQTGLLPFSSWCQAVSRGTLLAHAGQQRSRPAAFAGERRGHPLCQFHTRRAAASGPARCRLARIVFNSPSALGVVAYSGRNSVLRVQSRHRGCACHLGFAAHTAECRLTRRSTGAPTAGHLAREAPAVYPAPRGQGVHPPSPG
jgi:hypothetical protein